jgi:hypothetical protein
VVGMVTLGITVALALQSLVISGAHRAVSPWWAVSLASKATQLQQLDNSV